MVLQRCILNATRTYLSRNQILHRTMQQTCTNHKYSDDVTRKYTDRHEWVTIDDNIGTVGISSYAQDSLGDIVFAQLPDRGMSFKAGDECGALESVKAASEIYSPLSGTVTAKNESVEAKPALINTSCYADGWLFKLKLSDKKELDKLMNEEQYQKFLKTDQEEKEA